MPTRKAQSGAKLDAFRLAREHGVIEGSVDAHRLSRVADVLAEGPADVAWRIEGSADAAGRPALAIEIDGKSSPAMFSGYAPRVAPPAPTQAGKFPLQAGARKLSLKINGKVAQSTGYLVGLDQVKFYPAGALGPQAQAQKAPVPSPAPVVPLAQKAPSPGGSGGQSRFG